MLAFDDIAGLLRITTMLCFKQESFCRQAFCRFYRFATHAHSYPRADRSAVGAIQSRTFLLATWPFLFLVFPYFSFSVPCARLSWPSR